MSRTPNSLVASTLGLPTSRALPARAQKASIHSTQYLAHEGGQIAFDDTGGTGPLVVAIPGMGDARSEYRALRPALQQAGYRVVTMDVRGHGETSASWDDYSARAVGRDATALIRHLCAGSAVVLGNSFAAGAALWAAHDAPDSVRGVALLGPIVRDVKLSWLASTALKIGFAGPWRVWFWTTYWDSLFPARKPTHHAAAKAALSHMLREPGRMDALRTMVGLSKAETAAMLPLSRVPALVVMGSRDPDFPDATAEANWLSETLKAERLIVAGSGHYPHAEMPDLVVPTLLEFIDRLEPVGLAKP